MLIVLPILALAGLLYLVLLGASVGADRRQEDAEQLEYLKDYQAAKKRRL